MKNTIITLLLLTAFFSQAQVGIGVAPENIEPSAQLEVKSTSKGFLPPRMLAAERDAINNAVAGLIVFCTNCGYSGELQVYNGATWSNFSGNTSAGVGETIPTVTTTAISAITGTSANSGGTITATGGVAITSKGICWSIAHNPTLSNMGTLNEGSSPFTNSITGLTIGTTYYVRAYATNTIGTAYGDEVSFTTLSLPIIAATTTASQIIKTTATSGGDITSEGAANVTSRGVVWSTASEPTIALTTKTIDGIGIGAFTSSITGLTAGTLYYVRAYATNSFGTSYGNELSFTTGVIDIGDSYQGGIIAYLFQSGDNGYVAGETHGLIAATADQSNGIQWYYWSYIATGATGTAIGTGLANTNAIIAIQGGTATYYAAGIARNYTGGNYNDWYLPSLDELTKLYQNIGQGSALGNVGGFVDSWYWSSSEINMYSSWFLEFQGGNRYENAKSDRRNVRAIRSF